MSCWDGALEFLRESLALESKLQIKVHRMPLSLPEEEQMGIQIHMITLHENGSFIWVRLNRNSFDDPNQNENSNFWRINHKILQIYVMN